jgi:hypothetical protein
MSTTIKLHLNTANLLIRNGYNLTLTNDDDDDIDLASTILEFETDEATAELAKNFEIWLYAPSNKTKQTQDKDGDLVEKEVYNNGQLISYNGNAGWNDREFVDELLVEFLKQNS